MAEERTATLTMRKPIEGIQSIKNPGPSRRSTNIIAIVDVKDTAPSVADSVAHGTSIDVFSFQDAMAAVTVFYGLSESSADEIVVLGPGVSRTSDRQQEEVPSREGMVSSESTAKARHPALAWVVGTLRIMWFAIRHPGKAAWIDHRTGDVGVAY